MPDLSPFQTLPIHIAEAIGYYCIGLQRHRRRDVFSINQRTETTWLVLHDVSYSWMQLARRNLDKCAVLRLSNNPDNDKFATTLHSRRVIEQSTAIVPHVKEVDILFDDIVEEVNKENLHKLGRVWPEDLVFPKARSLTCYLGYRYMDVPDSARDDRYFKWFVERARLSFPNLQEFKMSIELGGEISVSPSVLFSKEWNASLFLLALFRTGSRDSASMKNEIILMNNAPELTSVCYHTGFDLKFASWIIKKSVVTLEKLHYDWSRGGGFKDFLFDDDGQVIVYPRLRDLRVFDSSDNEGELTTDKSIAPFPALQCLEMHSSCVFKDDTLFRGFNGTLTSLSIGIHRDIVDIFRKYKVFSQGTHSNMIHINVALDNRHGLTLPADKFAEAAFGLVSPATQSIELTCNIPYQCIASAIPTCPYLGNIQILLLEKTELSVLEVLDIFKHFPHVTDFGCRFRGIDSELDAIQDELIPSHLGTQYSQLISRLKCWHAYPLRGVLYEDRAVLFVTLAVLCPDFTFVKGSQYDGEKCDIKIGCILSSGLYDQHAKRLGRLFGL